MYVQSSHSYSAPKFLGGWTFLKIMRKWCNSLRWGILPHGPYLHFQCPDNFEHEKKSTSKCDVLEFKNIAHSFIGVTRIFPGRGKNLKNIEHCESKAPTRGLEAPSHGRDSGASFLDNYKPNFVFSGIW